MAQARIAFGSSIIPVAVDHAQFLRLYKLASLHQPLFLDVRHAACPGEILQQYFPGGATCIDGKPGTNEDDCSVTLKGFREDPHIF